MYDTPNVVHGTQVNYKRLFYSEPLACLRVPISIQAGYGIIEMGTVLSKNTSTSSTNKGKMLPYCPTTFTGDCWKGGRAYILATPSTSGAAKVYVTQDDSYRFKIGDDLILNCTGVTVENLGIITVIDRTTNRHMASITATETVSGTFTVALSAYVCVEASVANAASNNWSDAVGILDKDVDTGTGANAPGADATIIMSNATLYIGTLEGIDDAAQTAIGTCTEIGQFLMIK